MKNVKFEVNPERAEMSSRIVGVLTGVNDDISDKSLAQIIGQEVKRDNYALQMALRHMERADPPVCFRRIRGHGWKRQNDIDLVHGSVGALKTLSRSARRGSTRLGKVVDYGALPSGMQLQWATNQTKLFAIEDAASVRKPRRSAKAISDLQSILRNIINAATDE
jgi:hypothetical protein